jgi:BT1 family
MENVEIQQNEVTTICELTEEEIINQFVFQNYLMVILIALIQGSLDLCLLAYFYIYFYDHKMSPSELAALQAAAYLPWVFKPIFGHISQRCKFLGYNKKSYIFAISLLEFVMHTLIFKYRFGRLFTITCNVLQVVCVCFRNVIAEGLIASLTKRVIIRDRIEESQR